MKISDYFFAAIPGLLITIPFAQILPDMTILQSVEKLGIVGIMAAGILFFISERRIYLSKSIGRLENLDQRIKVLETKVEMDNDKIIRLLTAQLETLKEIKNGQIENFNRMWSLVPQTITDQKIDNSKNENSNNTEF
ncbi:MAG: hypothetical protein LBE18_12170 [Planctomycetaceae bacterium]|nr:hypothetical protein [Planctomycetaceae bacterium]